MGPGWSSLAAQHIYCSNEYTLLYSLERASTVPGRQSSFRGRPWRRQRCPHGGVRAVFSQRRSRSGPAGLLGAAASSLHAFIPSSPHALTAHSPGARRGRPEARTAQCPHPWALLAGPSAVPGAVSSLSRAPVPLDVGAVLRAPSGRVCPVPLRPKSGRGSSRTLPEPSGLPMIGAL